jgi:hypothetical protein
MWPVFSSSDHFALTNSSETVPLGQRGHNKCPSKASCRQRKLCERDQGHSHFNMATKVIRIYLPHFLPYEAALA